MAQDYSQIYEGMTTPQLITEAWDNTTDPKMRDRIMAVMQNRGRTEGDVAWPSAAMAAREEEAGLYPDIADPQIAARLYQKREFYEARAVAASVADGTMDPCASAAAEKVFELTPVQRVVSRFMHPLTPYMGLLLFHGVGVGKTCSAVTIAEQYLETSPLSKVIVLVPQALKENFKRTVIDPTKLVWDADGKIWQTRQCTGLSYLERLGLLTNPDIKAVTYKLEEDRRNRYTVTGYQAFANWIEKTLKKSVPVGLTDPEVRLAAENEVLRRLFSEHLIIVDEAHNLRDLAFGSGPSGSGPGADAVTAGEAAENQGGKALNPFLKRIVLNAEGLRLVLMSATPMYNLASEIILLLNFLIMNDAKTEQAALSVSDFFTKDGSLKNGPFLEKVARRYVSYMRGENPYTFPLRMTPTVAADKPASMWPAVSATKNPVILNEEDTAALNALPIVFTEPVPGSPSVIQLRASTMRGQKPPPIDSDSDSDEDEVVPTPVQADAMLDQRMQMGNICYPNSMYGGGGFDFFFSRSTVSGGVHKLRQFSPKKFDIDSVFSGEALRAHAPKIHRIVESIKSARGICFAYSRYIKAGALPLAFALERAGFQRRLADGRISSLLTGVPPVAPVCAICGSVEAGHPAEHSFAPACYVLLTSEEDLSPNFAGLVRQATTWLSEQGPLGSNVKAVIGSQVASEGLDLKCVREMHIMDSWYHLNRTDQIIGRAIRYCSHTALRAVEAKQGLPPMSLNNCLIYLHAIRVPETTLGPAFETADMYAYRLAIGKAAFVGKVQRLLKKHAWDCNLELEAITFAGLPPRPQIDAQGQNRRSRDADGNEMDGYSINDQDYTTYCDYQRCEHQCAVSVPKEGLKLDESTFGIADARRLVLAKQTLVRRLFDDQVMVPETMIKEIFSDLPWEIQTEALMELIDGRRFKLRRPDGTEGFLIKKAGYVIFQPLDVTDTEIPMTMRYARAFQLARHTMIPRLQVFARSEAAAPKAPPVLASALASASASAIVALPEKAPATVELTSLAEWVAFIDRKGPLPKYIESKDSLWPWLLRRYESVTEVRTVALQWWFDNIPKFAEQRLLLEAVILNSDTDANLAALKSAMSFSLYINSNYGIYRIYNPAMKMVEFFWKRPGNVFVECPEHIVRSIWSEDTNIPVAVPADTGGLLGFMFPKEGQLVYKSLDTIKPIKRSSIGAVCENVSNKGEHIPRIVILHTAERGSALAPFVLPDDESIWVPYKKKKSDKTDSGPRHLKDLTQQTMCLYMEFLTRLMDLLRIDRKRWFLNAIEASYSSLI